MQLPTWPTLAPFDPRPQLYYNLQCNVFEPCWPADIPVSFAYILPMMRYGNAITPEQTSVPKKVFAVMGALDGLSGIMQIFASTYLGGSLIILLTQVRR